MSAVSRDTRFPGALPGGEGHCQAHGACLRGWVSVTVRTAAVSRSGCDGRQGEPPCGLRQASSGALGALELCPP